MICDTLNKEFEVDDEVDVTISYGGALKRYVSIHSLEFEVTGIGISTAVLNTKEIREVLASNPWYYYANSRHVEYDLDSKQFQLYDGSGTDVTSSGGIPTPRSTPVCSTASTVSYMGALALVDNGSVFEAILNDDGTPTVKEEVVSTSSESGGEVLTYTYTLSFRYKGCATTSNIIHNVRNWYDAYYEDIADIPPALYSLDSYRDPQITSQIDTRIKRILFDMRYDPEVDYVTPTIVENSLYLKVPSTNWGSRSGYTSYLKVDAVAKMKRREFLDLLANSIDTDYTVEKKKWWEVVLFFVIIIIAVIAAIPSGGGSLALAGVILSVGAFILAQVGGLSSMDLVGVLGKFAMMVGIAALVANITAFINNMMNTIAEEAVQTSVANAGATFSTLAEYEAAVTGQLTQVSLVDVAIKLVSDLVNKVVSAVGDMFSTDMVSVNSVLDNLKYALKTYEFIQDQEQKKLDKEYAELKAEDEKYQEEVLNRPYVQAAGVFMMTHERLSTPDALQDLAIKIKEDIGQDSSYRAWYTDVNS